MNRRDAARGFTLVEVLVAMLVMAVLAVMAWQGVDGIVRASDASKARLEQTLRLGTVLAQWEQDLAAIQETNAAPPFSFDGASVRLTRRTDGGLQIVVWSLRPGLDGAQAGNTWLRWVSPATVSAARLRDDWLRSQQLQGTEAVQVRVLQGISEWQVYCFRGNGWSNCQSTSDLTPVAPGASSPQPQRVALPSGIRLVISFADGSGQSGSLTRDIALGPSWP